MGRREIPLLEGIERHLKGEKGIRILIPASVDKLYTPEEVAEVLRGNTRCEIEEPEEPMDEPMEDPFEIPSMICGADLANGPDHQGEASKKEGRHEIRPDDTGSDPHNPVERLREVPGRGAE